MGRYFHRLTIGLNGRTDPSHAVLSLVCGPSWSCCMQSQEYIWTAYPDAACSCRLPRCSWHAKDQDLALHHITSPLE